MPTAETTRSFTVSGDKGAEFIMCVVQNDTIKYYDWVDKAFELGHNNKDNNLKITILNSYSGSIKFPSGGGDYTIKLIASPGTEIQGGNKYVISRSIAKQTADATVTFQAATVNTSNYDTFPTSASVGALTDSDNFDFNWSILNASTDAGGFGLILNGSERAISDRFWYFTTTDTVDGAITESTSVKIDDLTDICVGMVISGVSAGSLSGIPTILSIDTNTKTLTLDIAQTFSNDITLTFKAIGSSVIRDAIGLNVTFTQYPSVSPTTLTKTTRTDSDGDYTTSTTITLTDTQGVSGGGTITYSGVDVDNTDANTVTSVTPDCPDPSDGTLDGDGLIVVGLTQLLRAGTVLTFNDIYKTIPITGNIVINSYPSANRTIYLDLDKFITVGTAS